MPQITVTIPQNLRIRQFLLSKILQLNGEDKMFTESFKSADAAFCEYGSFFCLFYYFHCTALLRAEQNNQFEGMSKLKVGKEASKIFF